MNVMLHIGGGYDIHRFLKDVNFLKKELVFLLPKQSTKFYNVKIGNISFIDTLNYLPFSLAKLSDSLTGENGEMKLSITRKILEMKNYSKFLIDKTSGKGSFPYEHMKCLENFNEEGIPSKDKFHSSLTGAITDERYSDVCDTFKDPKIKTIKDLHDLYIAQDVGILADVFEFYRKFCADTWGLDPCNYITPSSLYLDAVINE